MQADYAAFCEWLQTKTAEAEEARQHFAVMRAHPWFPTFLATIGATEEEWGKGDATTELQVWEEWRHCAEQQLLDETRREGQVQMAIKQADVMANCETQIVEDVA